MATIPVNGHGELLETHEAQGNASHLLRVIVADSQAIFRAGLRKIFAVEDDIRVVGQAETLPQVLSAAKKFSADILIMEAALSPNPADTVSELLRQTPSLRLVVVTAKPHEELTLELFRRVRSDRGGGRGDLQEVVNLLRAWAETDAVDQIFDFIVSTADHRNGNSVAVHQHGQRRLPHHARANVLVKVSPDQRLAADGNVVGIFLHGEALRLGNLDERPEILRRLFQSWIRCRALCHNQDGRIHVLTLSLRRPRERSQQNLGTFAGGGRS